MYIEIEWFNSYSPGQGISFSVEKITVDTEQDYGDLSLITGGGQVQFYPYKKEGAENVLTMLKASSQVKA